jgi:hypothetical protein
MVRQYLSDAMGLDSLIQQGQSYAVEQGNISVQNALENSVNSLIDTERSRYISQQVDSALSNYGTQQLDAMSPELINDYVAQQQQRTVNVIIQNTDFGKNTADAINNFGKAMETPIAPLSATPLNPALPQIADPSPKLSDANFADRPALSDKMDTAGLFDNRDSGIGDGMLFDAIRAAAPEISALAAESIFVGNETDGNMDAAVMLFDIIKSPNEEQSKAIEAASELMADIRSLEKDGVDAAKTAAIKSETAKAVAAVLLAQAIPDLLTEGDTAILRESFRELNVRKDEILMSYQQEVKPYYDEVRKMLANNAEALQILNILSQELTRQKIKTLPPDELEKIMEKLRNAKSNSSEVEYILQQEAKYKKKYLDPGRSKMEVAMKDMLKDFSTRVTAVINGAGTSKKVADAAKARVATRTIKR